ncbi:hypothetical protein [Bacillus sp. AFS017336]|uniref:hypothetical protein n=1 Tax=Bacillus sp. AFS017336 TaxID=2033489 RepID=UPI0015CF2E04|nr:hypothetical protein [Bacillus sp. AFS017336]
MNNKEMKLAIKKSNLFQWQIAEIYGVSESQFCRMLRHELHDDVKKRIKEIIKEIG